MIAHLMMIPKLCPAAFKHAPDKRENYFRRGGGACIVGLHAGKAVRGGIVHCVYKHGLVLRFAVFGYYGKYFAAGVFGKYAAWVAVRLQLKRAAGELRGACLQPQQLYRLCVCGNYMAAYALKHDGYFG